MLVLFIGIAVLIFALNQHIIRDLAGLLLPMLWSLIDKYSVKSQKGLIVLIAKARIGYSRILIEKIEDEISKRFPEIKVKKLFPPENQPENADLLATYFQEAVAMRPDAILITPPPRKDLLVDPIVKAIKDGIPVITVDDQFDVELFLQGGVVPPVNIRLDYAQGGKLAAELLKEKLKSTGNIAIISGPHTSTSSQMRKWAFIDEILKEAPNMAIVACKETDWGYSEAQQKMEEIIKLNTRVDGIFCCNDRLAMGAIETIQRHKDNFLKRKIPLPIVVGHDGIPGVNGYINDKRLFASVDQHIEVQARSAVDQIVSMFSSGPNYYIKHYQHSIVNAPSKLTLEVIKEKEGPQ